MPWKIERDDAFERALKELRKRFPNAERDILDAFESGHPSRTDPIPAFEKKLWKGRVGSSDLRRGTSRGFRVIYYWDETFPNLCCLGTFYFKGDCAGVPDAELKRLFVSVEARVRQWIKSKEESSGISEKE